MPYQVCPGKVPVIDTSWGNSAEFEEKILLRSPVSLRNFTGLAQPAESGKDPHTFLDKGYKISCFHSNSFSAGIHRQIFEICCLWKTIGVWGCFHFLPFSTYSQILV